MPKYFFSLGEHEPPFDPVGDDLRNDAHALEMARLIAQSLREMIGDYPASRSLIIRNEKNEVVGEVSLRLDS